MNQEEMIDTLRDGKPWDYAERAHCLHCRGDMPPSAGQKPPVVGFVTRHGVYVRASVRCRCGRNVFCLPVLNGGEETAEAGPTPPNDGGRSPDPGGGAPQAVAA